MWRRHVKGQEKEDDSMKETRGRTVAEEGVTHTNAGDLPETQRGGRQALRQV